MIIDTWINDRLVTLDTETLWAESFAYWDGLVETKAAEAIATAINAVLTRTYGPPDPPPAPKAQKAVAPLDTASMTDAELFAYYKRTALAGDLAFFLRGQMSDGLRARAEAIAKPTKPALVALRDAWRTERLEAERRTGEPAIGTEAWHGRDTERAA